MVGIGVLGTVLSVLLPDMWSLMAVIALLFMVAVSGTVYSWKLYHELYNH